MLKRFIDLTIITLLFVIAANAQSQQPTPGPFIGSNPPQIQASPKQQTPEYDKRGTEQSPLVVNTISPQKTREEIDQARKEHEEKTAIDRSLARYTYILAIVTSFLVLATIILAIVGWWQGLQMRRSVDSQIRAEKAYVFVKIVTKTVPIIGSVNEVYKETIEIPESIDIVMTNHGKTPAILADFRKIIFVDKQDAPVEQVAMRIKNITESWIQPGTVIIDGGKSHHIPGDIVIDEPQRHEIETLISTVYCVGRVKYKDIFGNERETGFCWKYEKFRIFVPIENSECHYHT
jgi:hypothetical protein